MRTLERCAIPQLIPGIEWRSEWFYLPLLPTFNTSGWEPHPRRGQRAGWWAPTTVAWPPPTCRCFFVALVQAVRI